MNSVVSVLFLESFMKTAEDKEVYLFIYSSYGIRNALTKIQ